MTVREQVSAWGEKYNQPEDVMTKALARADTCDACEHNIIVTEDSVEVNKCQLCRCRLIRTAFNEMSNPCPLSKFDEPVPPMFKPESAL